MSEDKERIIRFYPAYDRRHEDPDKSYGVHGVDIKFVLKGEEGAIQFVLFTGWQLPHVAREQGKPLDCFPLPSDLGYHSPIPRYEGHKPVTEPCEWLQGGPCYYDGSSLAAEAVFEILLREGDEGVWAELEKTYQRWLGEEA